MRLDVPRVALPVRLAIGRVAVAAWFDSSSTSRARAPQLYLTQATIAFCGTFFPGPALRFGMTRALQQGAGHGISLIRLFGIWSV